MSRLRACLLIAVLAAAPGCGIGQGQLADQVFRPGPARYQQLRATRFDPYSQQEQFAGPRDSTMRPRDALRPMPEPARGRWPTWGLPRFGVWGTNRDDGM